MEPIATTNFAEYTRHEDFWFGDGTIVILVEKYAFRVHGSILCKQSEVFSGMLDVPQPPSEPQMDGCPVVKLTDSCEQVLHALTMIYNGHK